MWYAESAEDHPKIYTSIHMTYRFEGDGMDPEKVKKAVRLSNERYCPVAPMISAATRVTYHIEINGEKI
jgi:putative redox protein